MPVPPTVLIFVADIMSTQRIETAAKRSGYQTLLIENEAELLVPAEDPGSDRAAEPLGELRERCWSRSPSGSLP